MTLATSTFILRCALALGLVLAACGDSDHEDATTDTEDVAQEEVHELTIEVEGSGKFSSQVRRWRTCIEAGRNGPD